MFLYKSLNINILKDDYTFRETRTCFGKSRTCFSENTYMFLLNHTTENKSVYGNIQ